HATDGTTYNVPWPPGGSRPGDIPLTGDLTGSGTTDLVIYRPGTSTLNTSEWFVATSYGPGRVSASFNLFFGQAGATRLVGDVDGAGYDQPISYVPGTSQVNSSGWSIAEQWNSQGTVTRAYGLFFGSASVIPLVGNLGDDGHPTPIYYAAGNS